jgi:hypothetical protein
MPGLEGSAKRKCGTVRLKLFQSARSPVRRGRLFNPECTHEVRHAF